MGDRKHLIGQTGQIRVDIELLKRLNERVPTGTFFLISDLAIQNMHTKLLQSFLFVLIALIVSTPCIAVEKTTLSLGIDYSTGDYGSEPDTRIWYLPVSIKLEQKAFVYKITIPYLQITGPGNIVGADANPGSGNGNGVTTESGMGDVTVAVSYGLLPYHPEELFIEFTGKVKFPTADENKLLGTGEYDYSLQTDLFYASGRAGIFGTLGYKFYGDPPGIDYQNVYYYSLGLNYHHNHLFSSGLIYNFKEAATTGGTKQQELMFYSNTKLDSKKKLLLYLVKGLSNGSPDWGIGLSFGYIL